jgi:hypothetical protein
MTDGYSAIRLALGVPFTATSAGCILVGMSATDSITPEQRRLSVRVPQPLWIGLAAGLLTVIAAGLRVGLPIYRQQVAIREIERVGGVVDRRPGKSWIHNWLSDERLSWFDEIHSVTFESAFTDDADLRHLRQFPNLRHLYIDRTRITDAGLVHLEGLTHLELLSLNGTQITDNGLTHLVTLQNLECLGLGHTGIAGRGLSHLFVLPKLRDLLLSGTLVTDASIMDLKRLVNLKHLKIRETQLSDVGIAELKSAVPALRVER